MKKWEKFTRKEIDIMVIESRSMRELATKIGYSPNGGGSISMIKQMIEELGLDTQHFTGQGWNKDNFDYSRFRKGSVIKVGAALPALIALRGHQCEYCENTQWNDVPIPLEIHHLDGNSINNSLDNLAIYCPNCHAQTDNYRGRNINNKQEYLTDEEFLEALKKAPNIRQALLALGLSAKGGNYARANELIVRYQINHLLK